MNPGGQKGGTIRIGLKAAQAPYLKYNPSRRNSESGAEVMATKDPDLEEPLELEPEGHLLP